MMVDSAKPLSDVIYIKRPLCGIKHTSHTMTSWSYLLRLPDSLTWFFERHTDYHSITLWHLILVFNTIYSLFCTIFFIHFIHSQEWLSKILMHFKSYCTYLTYILRCLTFDRILNIYKWNYTNHSVRILSNLAFHLGSVWVFIDMKKCYKLVMLFF